MAAAAVNYFLLLIITNYLCTIASSYDPMPLQDFCVADFKTPLGTSVRPFPCKDPKTVTANDFFQSGLNVAGDTTKNARHGVLTAASVLTIPGLNTLGFTLARGDMGVNGSFPLHYHQRASELIIVLEGCLEAGFIASAANNYTHFTKKLYAGDLFVIPVGLIHYWANCGKGNTSAYAILNSQSPGISSVTHSVFGPKPPINSDYLSNAYQLDEKVVQGLQAKDWTENI